jgi:ABC-type sugar transport system substrate-binding protein
MKRSLIIALGLFMGVMWTSQGEGAAQNAAPKKKWRIALSNSFYGNIWRHQMVDAFRDAAEKAKADGLISEYLIENGDGTVNQQNAQMSGLILRGVDAICINAASPTALNGVIAKACQAGIKVLAFDSIATADCAYKFDFDMVGIFGGMADYIASTLLRGKGNVLLVRGVEGSAPDKIISDAQKEVRPARPIATARPLRVGSCSPRDRECATAARRSHRWSCDPAGGNLETRYRFAAATLTANRPKAKRCRVRTR